MWEPFGRGFWGLFGKGDFGLAIELVGHRDGNPWAWAEGEDLRFDDLRFQKMGDEAG